MRIEDRVRTAVAERVDAVAPPQADVRKVIDQSRRRSTMRLVAVPVAGVTMIGGVVGGAELLPGGEDGSAQASLGQFDFSKGLRAYMSPDDGGGVRIAGRRFDSSKLADIDTDATATAYGMVYFDGDDQAHLLDEDGYRKPIGPVPDKPPEKKPGASAAEYHPSAKADTGRPLVAWTEYYGDRVTIRMHNLSSRETVATYDVMCGDRCGDVQLDAVSNGVAFVRTSEGSNAWEPSSDRWARITGTDTEIVDASNRTVLYTGARPVAAGPIGGSWRFVKGPGVDSELSHDGRHVLYWSPKLRPVSPNGEPIRLDAPRGAEQFTFDSDGSVLAATLGNPARVYDCDLASGACTKLEDVSAASGDVVFLGNDM